MTGLCGCCDAGLPMSCTCREVVNVVAIDLAAKFSAAVWMWEHTVIRHWDSWQNSESTFIDRCTDMFHPDHSELRIPDVLVIEDLPHRLPFMTNIKDVCRLQGRLVERMHRYGAMNKILFVPPAEWKRHYGAPLKQGTGPTAVVEVAVRMGYLPPDLDSRMVINPKTGRPKAGERATAKKVLTDYCAAYLIGRWAVDSAISQNTFDVARTSRYTKH